MVRGVSVGSLWSAADPATPDLDALEAHLAAQRADFTRFLMTWSLVVDLLWWLTDPLLLRGVPGALEAFAAMRLWVLACGATTLVLLHGQRALAGPRMTLCAAVCLVEVAGIAGCLARLGDLSTPWFHCLYPLVIATCVFPLWLRERAAFATLLGAALLAGFVAGRPEAVRPPYFGPTVGYMLFSVGVGIAFGHRFFMLTCEHFAQRRLITAQREDLQRQVDLRTEELRQLAQHLDRAGESERQRIARDLHDGLGQSVSALRLALSTTRRRFEREPGSISANLDDLDDLVRRVADGTRDAVTHLRPRVLDDQGLGAAAAWLVGAVQKHSGLDCALRVEGEDPGAVETGLARSADDVSLAAFRVLQEALTNVVRHAEAARVEVTLRFADGVSLCVDDDGAGITEGRTRAGMGLLGMRERARALGGHVAVEPRPGGGTRVRCELPARGAG